MLAKVNPPIRPREDLGNIWLAKSGFGGTEYLLPALVAEGMRRGLSFNRIAALTSANPRAGTPTSRSSMLSARVKATFLRGELICENGNALGKPRGRYLHRPTE